MNLVNTIKDPQTKSGQHQFVSIIIIALCAKFGAANDAVAIAQFGVNHRD